MPRSRSTVRVVPPIARDLWRSVDSLRRISIQSRMLHGRGMESQDEGVGWNTQPLQTRRIPPSHVNSCICNLDGYLHSDSPHLLHVYEWMQFFISRMYEKMRRVNIDEHGVGVFSQRPTNQFCGYFAELVHCNAHPKNEFDFMEFFNSKCSCWLVGILGVHCIKLRQRNKQKLSKYGLE